MIRQIKMEPETIFSPSEDDIMAQLQQDSSDLEVEPSFTLEGTVNGEYSNEGMLMQHMDIREPLSTLRSLLEERLTIDLKNYAFWLQNAQMVSNKVYHIIVLFYFFFSPFDLGILRICYNSWKAIKIWSINVSKERD